MRPGWTNEGEATKAVRQALAPLGNPKFQEFKALKKVALDLATEHDALAERVASLEKQLQDAANL